MNESWDFPLDKQVSNLELSMQLRGARFPPGTVFGWYLRDGNEIIMTHSECVMAGRPFGERNCSAPLVGEMREWLRRQPDVLCRDLPVWGDSEAPVQYPTPWKQDVNGFWTPFGWMETDRDADGYALTCLSLLRAKKEK